MDSAQLSFDSPSLSPAAQPPTALAQECMFTGVTGVYLEIVEHGLFDEANVMRSCLQVVNGIKHYFHCLVCNPVGCGEQRKLGVGQSP